MFVQSTCSVVMIQGRIDYSTAEIIYEIDTFVTFSINCSNWSEIIDFDSTHLSSCRPSKSSYN